MFEEKLKWSRDFVDYMLAEQLSSNCESAVENQKDIKRQAAEEVQEGAVLCLPEEEARRRFKGCHCQPWVQCLKSWARRR